MLNKDGNNAVLLVVPHDQSQLPELAAHFNIDLSNARDNARVLGVDALRIPIDSYRYLDERFSAEEVVLRCEILLRADLYLITAQGGVYKAELDCTVSPWLWLGRLRQTYAAVHHTVSYFGSSFAIH